MRSYHLLVNQRSGAGGAFAAAVAVARLLRDAGAEVQVTQSPGVQGSAELARRAAQDGRVVVAAGGDGMLPSIAAAVRETDGVLGLVPAGRGNDFARMLGVGGSREQIARVLLEGEPLAVDVIDTPRGPVLGSVYAGVDALASALVERAPRWLGGLQYPYAAVRSLVEFTPTRFTVAVDGETVVHEAATVVVANSGYYGSGMHIAPAASLTDGVLDVVIVKAASRLRLLRALPKVYDGRHVELDEVVVIRGTEVRVSSAAAMIAWADGEWLGPLPMTMRVLPAALRVLC